MRTNIQKLWMLITMLFASISASSYDFEVDGILYNIISTGDLTVEVEGCILADAESVTIPEKVEYNNKSLTIVRIARSAFYNNDKLLNVFLPNSIEEIKYDAFGNCINLSKINMPSSLISLGSGSFTNCQHLNTIELPERVNTVPYRCFNGCSNLKSVTGANIKIIGENAFSDCDKLSYIDFPLLEEIRRSAFSNTGFSIFNIVPSVKRIQGLAFSNCSNLTSFIIEESEINLNWYDNYFAATKFEEIGDFDPFMNTPLEDVSIYRTIYYSDTNYGFGTSHGPYGNSTKYSKSKEISAPFGNITTLRNVLIGAKVKGLYNKKHVYDNGVTSENGSDGDLFLFNRSDSIETLVIEDSKSELQCGRNSAFSRLKSINIERNLVGLKSINTSREIIPILKIGGSLTQLLPTFSNQNYNTIYIYNSIPPTANSFSKETYLNCVLHIPCNTSNVYSESEPWKNFWNIEEMDEVNSVSIENDDVVTDIIAITNLYGLPVDDSYKGAVIIRYSDGTAKKVLQK